jgi:membrane-associated phospholipid phosphatase
MPLFFSLKKTLIHIFSGKRLVLQLLAGILTYIIVLSGFDWFYFVTIQSSIVVKFLVPAIFIGGTVPMFVLPVLYLVLKLLRKKRETFMLWAIAQAAFLGWSISSFYKAFTGRIQPPRGDVTHLVDSSHDWNFGFLEHGIFWGWPSSHTTVAFAMSFACIALFPNNKKVFWGALLYAFYIGVGFTTHIHWFSEFVAGALLGAVIGSAVGKHFYQKLQRDKNTI